MNTELQELQRYGRNKDTVINRSYVNSGKRMLEGGLSMRAYEKDTGVKIPAWYLKLPQRVIDFISDMGIILNRLLTRRKEIKRTNKRNVKFYL